MSTDSEILEILLSQQEWQSFECKRAAVQPARLLETVVAFANTEGGVIAIGLEDPGKALGHKRIVGIGENPENTSEFLKQLEKEIDPAIIHVEHRELGVKNREGASDQLLSSKSLKATKSIR